jgi:hypothetical protein
MEMRNHVQAFARTVLLGLFAFAALTSQLQAAGDPLADLGLRPAARFGTSSSPLALPDIASRTGKCLQTNRGHGTRHDARHGPPLDRYATVEDCGEDSVSEKEDRRTNQSAQFHRFGQLDAASSGTDPRGMMHELRSHHGLAAPPTRAPPALIS